MPFKSQAQRGFMYSQHPKLAKEFEEATPKGAKLPEHVAKMSDGGEVKMDDAKGTLVGLRDLLRKLQADKSEASQADQIDAPTTSSDTVHGYAGGGQVVNPGALLAQLQPQGAGMIGPSVAGPSTPPPQPPIPSAPQNPVQPTPPPSLSDTTQALAQTPDTNYDFYQNLGSDQRNQLAQKLLAQQSSPGNLVAQGIGGIGDAIANSYGGKNNKAQDETMGIAAKNTENRLGAFDTARAQKLQDLQGSQEMMMNDPKGPIAQSMQKAFRNAGLNVPSGMPPAVMLKIGGIFGELAYKQAMMGIQGGKIKADVANQESERRQEAAKGLQSRSILQKATDLFSPSPATKEFQSELGQKSQSPAPAGHGIPDLGSTFNGGKVLSVKRIS